MKDVHLLFSKNVKEGEGTLKSSTKFNNAMAAMKCTYKGYGTFIISNDSFILFFFFFFQALLHKLTMFIMHVSITKLRIIKIDR